MKKTKQGVRDLNNLGKKVKRNNNRCLPGEHEWERYDTRYEGVYTEYFRCTKCPEKDVKPHDDDYGF